MKVISKTDAGLKRVENDDTLILPEEGENSCLLFGVADGMGTHQAGSCASSTAREQLLVRLKGKQAEVEALREAILGINMMLYERQHFEEELQGMGTTLSVVWFGPENAVIGHVGDSRVYLLRDESLLQLSRDHSIVQELIDMGKITREEALTHPMRHVITRAVGSERTVRPDVFNVPRQKGDIWLLCTDGISEYIPPERMREMLLRMEAEEAAEKMVEETLRCGASDNLSLIILEEEL